jgi:cation:H+ antiporter
MTFDIFELVGGLLLLLGGGEWVVRGATRLARALGVSPLAIGLTVVAFGTSAPELAVNVIAAVRDRGGISFGNIIGSNMANIGLIIGITALIRPILIGGVVIRRELPMMLLATACVMIMSSDAMLGRRDNFLDRSEGMVLLLLFMVFVYYTLGDFLRQRNGDDPEASAEMIGVYPTVPATSSATRDLLLTTGGLAALVLGAHWTVEAGASLARAFGVPEVIIGLTVLALGTSLPELVASLMATIRGHVDLAIGNVVGSNIFNLLLVGGVTAIVRPIAIPPGGTLDLWVLAGLSVMLMFVSSTRNRIIVRSEAVTLMVVYMGYLTWRVAVYGSG